MKKSPGKPVFLMISEILRNDILFGKMKPGVELNEKEISERFETSRAPVRESFRILEGEGLIVRNHTVGYRVRDINLEEFIERNILLKLIEREMLIRAIPQYTELELCQMERTVEKISKSTNMEEFISSMVRFSEIIYSPIRWEFSMRLVKQILFLNVPVYHDVARQYMKKKMKMTSHKKFIVCCREGKVQEAIDTWLSRYDESEKEVFSRNRKELATA
jgi:DNA-binding GntR family transcriptional regulator